MLYTTYNLAVRHNACERALDAWKKHAGKNCEPDTPIPLTDVLDVLGIDDCLWAFRTVQDQEAADIIATKFLTAIADKALIYFESKYPGDKRSYQAVEALRAYFLNPSVEAANALDDTFRAVLGANLSTGDRDVIWLLAGGAWNNGATCGSRFRSAYGYRWTANTIIGGRALAERKWQTAKLKELLEAA